jgi:hypothetical protein
LLTNRVVVTVRIMLEIFEAGRRAALAASRRQIEDSRRLIQSSRTLMAMDAIHIRGSKKTLAEARRILARVTSLPY